MEPRTSLLIIGAGPFGLATAAHAKRLGVEHVLVGVPMDFWKQNMPAGMYLRSGLDWHLDTAQHLTIARFLATRGLSASDVDPLALRLYIEYAEWFRREAGLQVTETCVQRLSRGPGGAGFRAELQSGDVITAANVVVALGFRPFSHTPPELLERLPSGRFEHTCTAVDLRSLAEQRCLIIGGRQSAFEWAALLVDAGAAAVHLSFRHDTPRFAPSEWAWAGELVERFVSEPGWYRRLSSDERDTLGHRFWSEGRLKLEPWLEPRIRHDRVALWPRTQVASTNVAANGEAHGEIAVRLDSGDELRVDRIILATGYKPALEKVPFLAPDLAAGIRTTNGCPVLDDTMQSSVPGLFVTSLLATNDFGPFFAFTVSARTAARLVGIGIWRG